MPRDRRIKIDLPDELDAKVRRLAEQYHCSLADVIRRMVVAYPENQQ